MAKSHKLNGKKAGPGGHAVGYGRPPKTHQFKPGKSGNPNGRPKGAPTFQTTISREMARMVPIKTNDGVIRVTKREAMVRKLIHRALEGDMQAMRLALQLQATAELQVIGEDSNSPDAPTIDVASDEEMIRRMLSRFEHLRNEEG